MMGFMLKYLSHFEVTKEDFRPGGFAAPIPKYNEFKQRMVSKFKDTP